MKPGRVLGAAPNPAVLGWEKSQRRFRALDPSIFSQPWAVCEQDPASHTQRLQRPAQRRAVTSGTIRRLPALCLPGCIPPSFYLCQGGVVAVSGRWRGAREEWGVPAARQRPAPASLLRTARSIRSRPPRSSFTSHLGPWEKEEKDEQELRFCQGGREGEENQMETAGRNTASIGKVPVMD